MNLETAYGRFSIVPVRWRLCSVGLFEVLVPAFCAAIQALYQAGTQPLVDSPTIRLLKGILLEEEERLTLGARFVAVLKEQRNGEITAKDWRLHCERFLIAARGLLGADVLPDGFSRPEPRASQSHRATL